MNSADQGVFPMDTAFKRRWSFEYMDINHGFEVIRDFDVVLVRTGTLSIGTTFGERLTSCCSTIAR